MLPKSFVFVLIGINTPGVSGQIECFGREASAQLTRILPPGTPVEMEKDISERDRFGRRRSVYHDGRMLNELLVSNGFAHAATNPPDVRYQSRFIAAQQKARSALAGLWGSW